MSFRLLIISSAFPPFQAPESAHTLFLCERLAERGVDVHLLTTSGNNADGSVYPGLTIHALMGDWSWRELPRFAGFLRANRPDAILLIHIDWIYACQPMITFAPALVRRLLPRTRFVTQFENETGQTTLASPTHFRHRLATGLARRLAGSGGLNNGYGALLRDSNRIIALSERHLDAFERERPGVRAKSEVIPAPPILNTYHELVPGEARRLGRQMLGYGEREFVVVYFGFIYPSKGVETLVAAFGSLPENARLVLVGGMNEDPYVAGLRQQIKDTGITDRVQWLGFCDDEKASLSLHAADICVLPFHAGISMNNSSFAVAVTHGLPVVTTCGETLEAGFVDGENVRLCPPRDPGALAAAMMELIENPEFCARLRNGARALAKEWFSPEHIITATLNAIGCSETTAVLN